MMDLPQPPTDTELRNIIDKLAQFVARNGLEFEQMTKNKQKGNPKFQFLYGGEYFNYYQYKVNTEQNILKQQGIIEQPTPNNWNSPPNMHNQNEIEQINLQQENLREQIKQSEQNLNAQHTVLLQQQQAQAEVLVAKCELDRIQKDADECGVSLQEIYAILQPIIDSCTKDSISNGKSWFLNHATNSAQAYCIVNCLLYKVIESTTFNQKLHVIYLVNDLLHHCARKNANDLKDALESVVVPMFCNAHISATDEQRMKLEKLLKLWESKANYLKTTTVEKMRLPLQSYQEYQATQTSKYTSEITNLTQQTKVTYERYQAQHQAFVCHAMQQVMELQQQKQALEQKPPASIIQTTNIIPLDTIQASLQQSIQNLNQGNVPPPPPPQLPPNDFIPTIPPPNINHTQPPPNLDQPPPVSTVTAPQTTGTTGTTPTVPSTNQNGIESIPFSQPPPGFFAPPPQAPPTVAAPPPTAIFPDFSKPPPGFAPNPLEPTGVVVEELVPTAPYYDLPAGLMVPLIKLEDTTYKPLDPKDIRLPPPAPPNERLLAAVEAFYSLPSHERPRDSEGWEKLGLYEYYKAKNNARKEKEELIAAGLREKSRSPTPVHVPEEKEPSPPKRRYQSESPPPTPLAQLSAPPPPAATSLMSASSTMMMTTTTTPAATTMPIMSPTQSTSVYLTKSGGGGRRSRSRSHSRSRSPPPSSSSSSSSRRKHQRRGRGRRSASRSSSPSPIRRSPSPPPPCFGTSNFLRNDRQELDSSNKGHQMLRKMGWGGSGLGVKEQGIDVPITGGDVRDRQDQFRGVGCNLNDPYENFRKNKGAAFITRMKARAEERANESKLLDY